MKKIFLICVSYLYILNLNAQVNYCDSLEIILTSQSLNNITCTTHTNGMNTFWSSQDWTLTDKYGNIISTVSGSSATFNVPSPMNSDTNFICVTSLLSGPALTIACNTCDTLVWNGTSKILIGNS